MLSEVPGAHPHGHASTAVLRLGQGLRAPRHGGSWGSTVSHRDAKITEVQNRARASAWSRIKLQTKSKVFIQEDSNLFHSHKLENTKEVALMTHSNGTEGTGQTSSQCCRVAAGSTQAGAASLLLGQQRRPVGLHLLQPLGEVAVGHLHLLDLVQRRS